MFNIKNFLCRFGFHNWSANRGGVRICLRCPAVDRHYGISGYLRRQFEITTTYCRGVSDADLREEWLKQKQHSEDLKYMAMAKEASSSSTCAKKQLGCVLVLKNTGLNIKGTYSIKGTNGPPQGLKKCKRKTIPFIWEKYTRTGHTGDDLILDEKQHGGILVDGCPRMDSHNGTDTQKCRAVHAERQVILKAAHLGLPTCGSTLYSYMGVPCKDCLLELWEAGVGEIVVIKETYYDDLSRDILKEWIDSGRKFRVVNYEKRSL
jgi:deoxycytidylate deaminase